MRFTPRTYSHEHPVHGTFFITHFEGRYTATRVYDPGRRCETLVFEALSYGAAYRACLKRLSELDARPEVARVG